MRFLELREKMLDDRGVPDIKEECSRIMKKAQELSPKFIGFEKESPDMQGLQDGKLMKQKHMVILHENMKKLGP